MALYDMIVWFYIYSIFGWCYETIYCSIEAGELVKRGFFYGPYLPIYGFGAIFVLLLLHKRMNKIQQFFFSMVVTTGMEYLTSWLLELIFNKRWWDYTNYRIQLNGRVCLVAALLFGVMGVVLVNFIHPRLKRLTDKITKKTRIVLASSGVVLLLTDFVFSVFKAYG